MESARRGRTIDDADTGLPNRTSTRILSPVLKYARPPLGRVVIRTAVTIAATAIEPSTLWNESSVMACPPSPILAFSFVDSLRIVPPLSSSAPAATETPFKSRTLLPTV